MAIFEKPIQPHRLLSASVVLEAHSRYNGFMALNKVKWLSFGTSDTDKPSETGVETATPNSGIVLVIQLTPLQPFFTVPNPFG
jgi:hypothetical protein